VEFLACAKEIALNHHEKWDGSGYPRKLAGPEIPISARLMAVADVYDALTTRRVYRDAIPHEAAVRIIMEGAGKHFDPDVVVAFTDTADQFEAIACRYSDLAESHELQPAQNPEELGSLDQDLAGDLAAQFGRSAQLLSFAEAILNGSDTARPPLVRSRRSPV